MEKHLHLSNDTPKELREFFKRLYESRLLGRGRSEDRFCFYYGDPKTGAAWGDVECGYVGFSTGPMQIPLVLHRRTSYGGGGLLTGNIILVEPATKRSRQIRGYIYKHPNFHLPPGVLYNRHG